MWPFKPRPKPPNKASDDHTTIHVQFIDQATNQPFAHTDVPIDRLPESFEAATTMHLGEQDWTVLEARPVTAAKFRRSGQLVLIMRRANPVTLIDPSKLLFSLPTITNDALPPIAPGSSKLNQDVIEIHEDDWRQIEWISATAGEAITSELKAIREIYEHHRDSVGFRKLHLRQAIPAPLADRQLRLDDLLQALGPRATRLAGFAYRDVAGIAESSFAIRLISSIELYGFAPLGQIQTLCVAATRVNNVPQPDIENLARFAAAHDLILVDWCAAAAAIAPSPADYLAYFTAAGTDE